MFQVDGLGIQYGGRPLFSNAKFELQEKEKIGLVGRNGSGKSTFFRLLVGDEVPDEGNISIQRHYTIGILRQHIHFEKKTILEEAALGLPQHEKDSLYKAEAILFGLGFKEDDLDRSPSEFSGGYQLRLHLAKVLISEPHCLLLDEPTNYLDIASIRWFTKFLQQWKGEFILISHDREFMDSVTTHTMGIHREKIRKIKGSTVDYYEKLILEEEIHEKTRQNQDKKRAQAQAFIDRFGAKASKATQAQSRQKMLDRVPVLEKLKMLQHLDFEFHSAPFPGKKMIHAHEIHFSYDEKKLINHFSLEIGKGEKIAIVGKNGRGKSTLLRLFAKELYPETGSLKHSENLSIGYFGQTHIDRLNPKHSVEEEIATGNPKLNRTEIKSICGLMMFSQDQAGKQNSMLSGGEKSRVLLGKIIAKPCNLLLLDEPTHHLDMESIEALIDALEEFEGSVIIVTHSELILKRLNFDKIIVCHEGKQELFMGNYMEFLEVDGWHDKEVNHGTFKKTTAKIGLVKQSSKSPQTLEREISQLELKIQKMEDALSHMNQELLTYIEQGHNAEVQKISKALAEKQKEIESAHNTLGDLYNQI